MAERPMEPREALARAMRDNAGWRPPLKWERTPISVREAWMVKADRLIRHLGEAGFTIARADGKKEVER